MSVRSLDFSFNNVSYKLNQSQNNFFTTLFEVVQAFNIQSHLYDRSVKMLFAILQQQILCNEFNYLYFGHSPYKFLQLIPKLLIRNTYVCMNEEPLHTPLHSQVSFNLQLVIKFIFFETHI